VSNDAARSSAFLAAAILDELRQHDIFRRVEIGQQVVELIDEAELIAAHPSAPGRIELRRLFASNPDRTAKPPSSSPTACSRVDLPEPDGPSKATISPCADRRGRHRAAPRSSRPPCWKLRFERALLETGSLIKRSTCTGSVLAALSAG
jgi:hypothetical protein